MDAVEFGERKTKLLDFLDKSGIDKVEVEKYIQGEILESVGFGMTEDDARTRAIVSTVNYYRKHLDKLGSRAKFMCFGVSQPTDYGLKKHVMEVKRKWRDLDIPQSDKEEMVQKGIVNEHGVPLHTNDTTLFEDRIGSAINLDDEISQQLVGVIEGADGKRFPAIVRANGKKACGEQKYLYTWCLISGEQGKSTKHPNYVILNSRELLMKPLKDSKRLSLQEYSEIVSTYFKESVIDLHSEEDVKKLLVPGMYFLKNARMLNYEFSVYGATTGITTARSIYDLSEPIVGEARISNVVEINVDTKRIDEIWLVVQTRTKRPQDIKLKMDIMGMYVENPVDRSQFKMENKFMLSDDEEETTSLEQQPVFSGAKTSSVDTDKFLEEMEKRNTRG